MALNYIIKEAIPNLHGYSRRERKPDYFDIYEIGIEIKSDSALIFGLRDTNKVFLSGPDYFTTLDEKIRAEFGVFERMAGWVRKKIARKQPIELIDWQYESEKDNAIMRMAPTLAGLGMDVAGLCGAMPSQYTFNRLKTINAIFARVLCEYKLAGVLHDALPQPIAEEILEYYQFFAPTTPSK